MKYLYMFFNNVWYPMSYWKVEVIRETKTLIIVKKDGEERRFKKHELIDYQELRRRWNSVKSSEINSLQAKILKLESEMLPEQEVTE